jgi:FdhD protein
MTGFPNDPEQGSAARFSVKRIDRGNEERIVDAVAVEEPLAIYLTYWAKERRVTDSLAVVMRTPGHDVELAAGYLLGEGVIRSRRDIIDLQMLGPGNGGEVRVELAPTVDVDAWRLSRTNLVASSCGICGKRWLQVAAPDESLCYTDDGLRIDAALVARLPGLLRSRQEGFAQTGGLHAAALVSAGGRLEAEFEDIGRHNALDKVVGSALLAEQLPLVGKILFLSSRGSYELVQKAVAAGASVLATVGGPSSLAIASARHWGLTLLGFVRGERFNLYAGDWRLEL